MHPLDGPRLKLQVAKRESADLKRVVTAFLQDESIHSIVREKDPNTGEDLLRARVTQLPDPEWGIRLGLTAHLLRSALDNLVWQLSLLTGATPHRMIGFPIHENREMFYDRCIRQGTLKSLGQRHVSMIEAVQPYNEKNSPKYLVLLRELSNTDKHKLIPFTVVACNSVRVEYEISDPNAALTTEQHQDEFMLMLRGMLQPFVDGAILARPHALLSIQPRFTLQARFGDECQAVARNAVFPVLKNVISRVEEVIEQFAPDFPIADSSNLRDGVQPTSDSPVTAASSAAVGSV